VSWEKNNILARPKSILNILFLHIWLCQVISSWLWVQGREVLFEVNKPWCWYESSVNAVDVLDCALFKFRVIYLLIVDNANWAGERCKIICHFLRGNHINNMRLTRNNVHHFLALFGLRIIIRLVLRNVVLYMLLWRKLSHIVLHAVGRNLKPIFAIWMLLLISWRILLVMSFRLNISPFISSSARIAIYCGNIDYPSIGHSPVDHEPLISRSIAILIIAVNRVQMRVGNPTKFLLVHHC